MDQTETFIMSRPRRVTRYHNAIYPYDPASLRVVNSIPAVHKSSQKLSSELNRTVAQLSHSVESLRSGLHGSLSYEQFMADMLYHDEVVLANRQFLQYAFVTFELLANHGSPVLPHKKTMTQGRAFLTNRRLIVLSNEGTCSTAVAGVAYTGTKPSKYSVKCEAGDAFHYQYLPLSSIRAVEFDAIIGASMSTYIDSQEACCLLKMLSWLGHAMCLRSWNEVGRVSNPSLNQRVLKLSVDLPPWGNPCIVSIYVQPTVSMLLVKEFLRDLQSYSPAMKIKSCEKEA
ncbi:uncharacterized protein LOC117113600 [Anneissia japonica]|uniref:uncharacterized protein LOC117113600 n=1 Tax=Anneissia japonica TaxID=1529436 RepID=UPI001425979B|nr:uncharacterized protein LOC117113600 [Anneissia japonica]